MKLVRTAQGFVQIVIIAVMALVIGAAAIYGYQKLTTKPSPSPSPTDRSIRLIEPSPSPTDETANWKVYTNKVFGYSIKYPGFWFDQGPYGGQAGYDCLENIDYGAIAEFSKTKLTDCGFVGEQLPPQEADVTIWVLNEKFPSLEKIISPNYSVTQIAGEKATKYPFTEKSELPNIQATRIYFNRGNKGYIIFLKQLDNKGTYDKLYDQILTTFRFLE